MQSFDTWKFQIIKIQLLILCLGIGLIGKKHDLWPIISWPMYHSYSPDFPANTTTNIKLKVVSDHQKIHTVALSDLFARDRLDTIQNLIEPIVEEKDVSVELKQKYNQSLIKIAQETFPKIKIKEIQIWQSQWDVNPLSIPPLIQSKPSQETQIYTIRNSNY